MSMGDTVAVLNLLNPTPGLPDDTALTHLQWPPRIRNLLGSAGLKTVGDIRKTPDVDLLMLRRSGVGTVQFLRKALGGPRP
jgi:hypothetical protein